MRLADFILANLEPILVEWEAFARSIDTSENMDVLALRDHAKEILLATVRDMRSVQTAVERADKSRGHSSEDEDGPLDGASELHAIGRLGSGFDLMELVSEYRALRASVLRIWHDRGGQPHDKDVDDVTRFNESIDQSLAKSVSSYTMRVDQSRDLFLAILGHDLRNPLGSIAMAAEVLGLSVPPGGDTMEMVSQITSNAEVMTRMINDLLDFTRTRLGAGMPVSPASMDLGVLCKELSNDFRTAHPTRNIHLQSEGNLHGNWDADRLRQTISNLLGNAIQHSPEVASVRLKLSESAGDVVLVVHNEGPPIPSGDLETIFDPLVRGSRAEHRRASRPGSIGLGLYIARAIAESHGGTLSVTSTSETGTAFTLRLPREFVTQAG